MVRKKPKTACLSLPRVERKPFTSRNLSVRIGGDSCFRLIERRACRFSLAAPLHSVGAALRRAGAPSCCSVAPTRYLAAQSHHCALAPRRQTHVRPSACANAAPRRRAARHSHAAVLCRAAAPSRRRTSPRRAAALRHASPPRLATPRRRASPRLPASPRLAAPPHLCTSRRRAALRLSLPHCPLRFYLDWAYSLQRSEGLPRLRRKFPRTLPRPPRPRLSPI